VLPRDNKMLSSRRETARCFVSLNVLLNHSLLCRTQVPISRPISLKLCLYLVPFLMYFSIKEWCDLETGCRGRSRSLKITPFDRYDFLLVRHWNSSILYRFRVIWRWIILWPWMSLTVIQISTIRFPIRLL